MPRTRWLYVLMALVLLWCVCMPAVAAYNWAHTSPFDYSAGFIMFKPDLITAAAVLACLPFSLGMPRGSAYVFAGIGMALLIMVFKFGTAGDLWPISTVLLFLLSWRLRVRSVAPQT